MPSRTASIHPLKFPPNTEILLHRNNKDDLSLYDQMLVIMSSIGIIGSVVWTPYLCFKLYQKYKSIPKEDLKRRRIFGCVFLSSVTILLFLPVFFPKKKTASSSSSFRKWRLLKAWANYVSMEIVRDLDYTDEREKQFDFRQNQVVYAVIPHGLFPFSLGLAALPDFAQLVLGRFRLVVASATRFVPILRTILAWVGSIDATKSTVTQHLTKGESIGLSPGGIAEMFIGYPHQPSSHRNDEYALLAKRKGFLKLAVQQNIPVLPIYCFGATKMFHRIVPFSSLLEKISNWFRISLIIFYGRWWWCPFVPFRQKLLYVIGKPIFPSSDNVASSSSNTTVSADLDKKVDEMHRRFCDELLRIFDRYKDSYGWGDKTLNIV